MPPILRPFAIRRLLLRMPAGGRSIQSVGAVRRFTRRRIRDRVRLRRVEWGGDMVALRNAGRRDRGTASAIALHALLRTRAALCAARRILGGILERGLFGQPLVL